MHELTLPPAAATRRAFLQRCLLAPAALAGVARALGADAPSRQVRFGLIADIHQDVMPDGLERLEAFVAAMDQARPDFILQLGDFCQPIPRHRPFLEVWNRFGGPRYHVLGNHDMDGGFQRDQTVAFYGMPARHYAFDAGPLRGLVLDGNEPGGKAGGYKRFMGPDQLAWLERELTRADRPVMLFTHQPFDADNTGCLENSAAVRAVIARVEKAKPGTVAAVFAGHLHLDYARVVEGVRYVAINSASYWWLENPAARRESFPPEVHKAHPHLVSVVAYRDPLWALVTFDAGSGALRVAGRRTAWIGPDPWARGERTSWPREYLRPAISDRLL